MHAKDAFDTSNAALQIKYYGWHLQMIWSHSPVLDKCLASSTVGPPGQMAILRSNHTAAEKCEGSACLLRQHPFTCGAHLLTFSL